MILRPPTELELLEPDIRGVATAEIETRAALLTSHANRVGHERVVGTQIPVSGVRCAVLVNHRVVPGEEHRSGDGCPLMQSEQGKPEIAAEYLLPERAEESARLRHHT